MNIITVQSTTELPQVFEGYVCMTPMEAAASYKEKHGTIPETVYQRVNKHNVTTIYIPVEGEHGDNSNL